MDRGASCDVRPGVANFTRRSGAAPMTTDLDRRFDVMEMFGPDHQQILSIATPPPSRPTPTRRPC